MQILYELNLHISFVSSVYHLTQRLLVEAHSRGGGISEGVGLINKRVEVCMTVYFAVLAFVDVEPFGEGNVVLIVLCFAFARFD